MPMQRSMSVGALEAMESVKWDSLEAPSTIRGRAGSAKSATEPRQRTSVRKRFSGEVRCDAFSTEGHHVVPSLSPKRSNPALRPGTPHRPFKLAQEVSACVDTRNVSTRAERCAVGSSACHSPFQGRLLPVNTHIHTRTHARTRTCVYLISYMYICRILDLFLVL